MVGAEPDLVLGQDHPAGELAAQLALCERVGEAGQACAREPDGNRRADTEVPGAADDLLRLGVPDLDLAELQLVRVRMMVGREHAADDEVLQVVALVGDAELEHAVHLERRQGEATREVGDRDVEVGRTRAAS